MTVDELTKKADILVVDDVLDNIRLLSNFLVQQGYDVRTAINGQMALMAINALMPDLILLDIRMPGISGYEICQQLKANPVTRSIPVIFLSAGSDATDKVQAFEVGGADYVTKPFQLEEVLARVQTQLTIRDLQQKQEQQNLKLQQALDDLQKAQRHLVQQERLATLKQVAAGVAHEVNNPLSFIFCNTEPACRYIEDLLTLVELYQKDCSAVSPETQEFLQKIDFDFAVSDLNNIMRSIKYGADRIRVIVSALQSFTHLDEEQIKETNIHTNIETVLGILHHRLDSRPDNVIIDVQKKYGDLPLMVCYVNQLNQVLFNLLANAIDAIDEKLTHQKYLADHPQITITTAVIHDQTIQIRIRDNGSGISDANQKRLFEPFFTTKPAGSGVGMGLATSRRIIEELHQGRLMLNTSTHEGTEFIIQIPLYSNLQ
ncbi:MAG TPA: response regulator [Crinalium sp.]|jgi:signal transduction histidine kinase